MCLPCSATRVCGKVYNGRPVRPWSASTSSAHLPFCARWTSSTATVPFTPSLSMTRAAVLPSPFYRTNLCGKPSFPWGTRTVSYAWDSMTRLSIRVLRRIFRTRSSTIAYGAPMRTARGRWTCQLSAVSRQHSPVARTCVFLPRTRPICTTTFCCLCRTVR